MKSVLVTGAGGFIGSHLIRRLVGDGCAVRALVRDSAGRAWPPDLEICKGDVRDAGAMKDAAAGMDTVFHLAGKVHTGAELCDEDKDYVAVNVEGTRNVLKGAVAAGCHALVFLSSVKAMGEITSACLDESSEAAPLTAYGRSKLAAEGLVLGYGRQSRLHVSCLRLPLVYGPGNKGNLFFKMISAIDRGLFFPIPEVGNRRSVVHVANVVEAAILAANAPAANAKLYIVTDAVAYSTRKMYELICRALDRPIPQWCMPRAALTTLACLGDVIERVSGRRVPFDSEALQKLLGSAWYSSEKISRELNYRAGISFEDALPTLIDWYRRSTREL